ncbi:MAG: hypothetical protein JXL97_06225 [Bacteroidales bacterium]|nr:hypothetical protein [Bacteroidales bacterium]
MKETKRINVNEEVLFDLFGIKIKLLSFERIIGGKEMEEFGDLHEFIIKITSGDEINEIERKWTCRTPDDYKNLKYKTYKIEFKDSSHETLYEVHKTDWIEFSIEEINTQPDSSPKKSTL